MFTTIDMQFGFKEHSYKTKCPFALTETVNYFRKNKSNVSVGETGASPPTGHVRQLALTSLQFFFGNSGNMTLLHIHQCTTDGNMKLASQKLKH